MSNKVGYDFVETIFPEIFCFCLVLMKSGKELLIKERKMSPPLEKLLLKNYHFRCRLIVTRFSNLPKGKKRPPSNEKPITTKKQLKLISIIWVLLQLVVGSLYFSSWNWQPVMLNFKLTSFQGNFLFIGKCTIFCFPYYYA